MELIQEFACNEIKGLRKFTQMTQKEFAEKYHIEQRTLQNWEQKVSAPTNTDLYLLKRCIMQDTGNIGILHTICDGTIDFVLTNNVTLFGERWNGEIYRSYKYNEYNYRPIQIPISYDEDTNEPDQWEIVGFEQIQ